jgi:hypothetical protein
MSVAEQMERHLMDFEKNDVWRYLKHVLLHRRADLLNELAAKDNTHEMDLVIKGSIQELDYMLNDLVNEVKADLKQGVYLRDVKSTGESTG